jgi:hypothetical protein
MKLLKFMGAAVAGIGAGLVGLSAANNKNNGPEKVGNIIGGLGAMATGVGIIMSETAREKREKDLDKREKEIKEAIEQISKTSNKEEA